MTEIVYNDPALKDAAYKLAEETPRHLDQPTTPPIRWREDGGLLRVLLADGRTVRGPLPVRPENIISKKAAELIAPTLMSLPAHDTTLPPSNLKPNGKRKPANHKAGH